MDTILCKLFGDDIGGLSPNERQDRCGHCLEGSVDFCRHIEIVSSEPIEESSIRIVKYNADYPSLDSVIKSADRKGKEVLADLRYYNFIKIELWCLYLDEEFRSLHIAHIGKKKSGVWEPYLNTYVAYTPPEFRRKKFASKLYFNIRQEAIKAGCRRIKSLAGSTEGMLFHQYFGDQFWGFTKNREVVVDSPLIDAEFPKMAPMKVRKFCGDRITPLTLEEVKNFGNLRYD